MDINNLNYQNVLSQIQLKKGYLPYYATENTTSIVLTDYDYFPYKRWWRGQTGLDTPIVAEREAGWRPRQDACYSKMPNLHKPPALADFCFETACSTVYPCKVAAPVDTIGKIATNIASNNSPIIEYR